MNIKVMLSKHSLERIFNTENGLKSHMGKMHKPSSWSPIPQIDGCMDENFVKYSFQSDYTEFQESAVVLLVQFMIVSCKFVL